MAHAGDAELREKREKENALGPFFENLVDDVQSGATRLIFGGGPLFREHIANAW